MVFFLINYLDLEEKMKGDWKPIALSSQVSNPNERVNSESEYNDTWSY